MQLHPISLLGVQGGALPTYCLMCALLFEILDIFRKGLKPALSSILYLTNPRAIQKQGTDYQVALC